MSRRYSGQRAASSWCVPVSRTLPSSSTTMRSARFSVDRRCAIISVVRPRRHLAQRDVDRGLQARVDRRGRIVEHEQLRVGDQCPGQGDPLPLPAGQRQALLADHGVIAFRQPPDELVGLRRRGGGEYLLVSRVWPPVADVGADGIGEQEAVLHDQADGGTQGLAGQPADLVVADPDFPADGVVEAGQQLRDRRLARTGGADDGDRLAGFDVQRQSAQHRLGRPVAEVHVVEDDAVRRQAGDRSRPAGR